MKRVLVTAAVALAGCGGADESPEGVVKEWAAALNEGDGERVCELSLPAERPCEPDSRKGYDGKKVVFQGLAGNGNPDDRAYSLRAGRDTLIVTAVPRNGDYVVRFDAVFQR